MKNEKTHTHNKVSKLENNCKKKRNLEHCDTSQHKLLAISNGLTFNHVIILQRNSQKKIKVMKKNLI